MRRGALLLAGLVMLAACGDQPAAAVRPAVAATAAPASTDDATDAASCASAPQTLRPPDPMPGPGAMPAGSFMDHVRQRGFLIAGVPRGTPGFGSVDPAAGLPAGFDVEMVKQVSLAIFGDENHVEYRLVTTPERVPLLQSGAIDIVASTMTITCGRWTQVGFSTDYYIDHQRVLVTKGSPYRSLADLRNRTVCATTSSTSIYFLQHHSGVSGLKTVAVSDNNDCLVMLQRGQVDAISTNEGILDGLRAEDPYTEIVGPPLTDEEHGMAISLCHKEFIRFVDGTLDRMRSDGTWARLYGRWLAPWLGAAAPPAADYGDRSPAPPYSYCSG
jgi:polar amino acid transport system substrate-binding protein